MTSLNISRLLFILIISLAIFGLLMVGNASIVSASRDFGDKWYYFKLQAVWTGLGLVGLIFMSRFPHRRLELVANLLFIGTLLLLGLVLIPGIGTKLLGARRWINLGFISLQPAEMAKLTIAIYLAKLFKTKPRFVHLVVICLILGLLVLLEPDMGTALVLVSMCLAVYFGSGGKLKSFLLGLPVLALLAAGLIFLSPYRVARVKTFFNTSHDPQGASYQVRQALIGLGSGGVFGVGLGQSRQKYEFLPEVTTDSIFAVIGEELGLIGTVIVVCIFATIVILGLQVAKLQSNQFSANLALAFSAWFGFQSFINISAIVALLPFTGIPLTYISYGGSSLVITLLASGILINIAHDRKK